MRNYCAEEKQVEDEMDSCVEVAYGLPIDADDDETGNFDALMEQLS